MSRKPESHPLHDLLETVHSRGRRGPLRRSRLRPLGAAIVAMLLALKNMKIQALARLLHCSVDHARNVLGRRRGLDARGVRALSGGLVSPWHSAAVAISPVSLPWLDQLLFAPFLEPRRSVSDEATRARLVIDKLVLKGVLLDRAALLGACPAMEQRPGDPGTSVNEYSVAADARHLRVIAQRSEADWLRPSRRRLPYDRTVNLLDDHRNLVGSLSIDHRRRYCRTHRPVRAHLPFKCEEQPSGGRCPPQHFRYDDPSPEHRCGRCRWPDTQHRRCPRCALMNRCSECDRVFAATSRSLRLEITGHGCSEGLIVGLVQKFVSPFVDDTSVEIQEIHVALDLDVPFADVIPFQEPGSRGVLRSVRSDWDGDRSPGLTFGRAGYQVSFYDKLGLIEAVRLGAARPDLLSLPRPEHTLGWQDVTRVEWRIRPRTIGACPSPDAVLDAVAAVAATWHLADLRRFPWLSAIAPALALARFHGFVPQNPSAKRAAAKEAKYRDPNRGKPHRLIKWGFTDNFVVRLLDVGFGRVEAERHARVLQQAISDELARLATASSVHLGRAVESHLPALRRCLRDAFTSRSSATAGARIRSGSVVGPFGS